MILKVIRIEEETIIFENEIKLYSDHHQDCCENHYLDTTELTLDDFKNMKFDLSNDNFFERVSGYGIRLKPILGHPVSIPGYGYNNGYYSDTLILELFNPLNKSTKIWDITDCQVIKG